MTIDPVARLNTLRQYLSTEEMQELSIVVEAYRITSANSNNWVTAVAEFYVDKYGRPSDWHSLFHIGARIIIQIKHPPEDE